MKEIGRLEWADKDDDRFMISTLSPDEQDDGVIATINLYSHERNTYFGVYVDEGDALALIDWLQQRVRQASSIPEAIPHTDVPVKDDTK